MAALVPNLNEFDVMKRTTPRSVRIFYDAALLLSHLCPPAEVYPRFPSFQLSRSTPPYSEQTSRRNQRQPTPDQPTTRVLVYLAVECRFA